MLSSVNIRRLAALLRSRRNAAEPPYTLLLGSAMTLTADLIFKMSGQADRTRVYQALRGLSQDERFALLSNAWSNEPVPQAYRDLAQLMSLGYFNIVVTTDPSSHLESALVDAHVPLAHFDVIVLARDADVARRLNAHSPQMKIIKLRGDLGSRSLGNLSPDEALSMTRHVEPVLRPLLDRDSIVVGLAADDYDIDRYIRASEGALWIVTPIEPSADSFVYGLLHARAAAQLITGERAEPQAFFSDLLLETGAASVIDSTFTTVGASVILPRPMTSGDFHDVVSIEEAQGGNKKVNAVTPHESENGSRISPIISPSLLLVRVVIVVMGTLILLGGTILLLRWVPEINGLLMLSLLIIVSGVILTAMGILLPQHLVKIIRHVLGRWTTGDSEERNEE